MSCQVLCQELRASPCHSIPLSRMHARPTMPHSQEVWMIDLPVVVQRAQVAHILRYSKVAASLKIETTVAPLPILAQVVLKPVARPLFFALMEATKMPVYRPKLELHDCRQ